MFACLYSLSAPLAVLMKVAQDFTPRFEILGSVVLLDLAGLSRLFGSPREIGRALRTAMGGAPVRIALAPSQTAAALLALGRPGLTVVSAEEQPAALASLQVTLLGQLEGLRQPLSTVDGRPERSRGVDRRRARRTRRSGGRFRQTSRRWRTSSRTSSRVSNARRKPPRRRTPTVAEEAGRTRAIRMAPRSPNVRAGLCQ